MRIGVDLDGCLANFHESFIRVVKRVTGRNLFPDEYEPHCWNYLQVLGYDDEEVKTVWIEVNRSDRFWSQLMPYRTTYDDLLKLRMRSNTSISIDDVYFVTNRTGVQAKYQTECWLHQHGFPNPTVLISAHKGLAAKTLDLDLYVDDWIENIADVRTVSPRTMSYLFSRPWNKDATGATCSSVADAIRHYERVVGPPDMV